MQPNSLVFNLTTVTKQVSVFIFVFLKNRKWKQKQKIKTTNDTKGFLDFYYLVSNEG